MHAICFFESNMPVTVRSEFSWASMHVRVGGREEFFGGIVDGAQWAWDGILSAGSSFIDWINPWSD